MNLEYLTFDTHKDPDKLAESLRAMIQQHKLGDRVLRFCLQKGANKRDGYWAFLAVQSGAELPPIFYRFLEDLNIRLKKERLSENDVAKMLAFRYFSLERPDPILTYSKPIRRFDMSFGDESIGFSLQTEQHNQLLYWLSACGQGNWSGFRSLCQTLNLANTPSEARYLMRGLYLLGHIEVSGDGNKWEIAPPAWVQTDLNQEWFLAGARAAADKPNFETNIQPQGPERWSCQRVNTEAPLAGAIAREMALHLPDLLGWKESLSEKTMDKLSNYCFERWNGSKHEPLDHHTISQTGIYRVTPQSQRFVRQYNLYYDSATQRWLQADWSGLRLLADFEHGMAIEWIYLPAKSILCLRADQRPPLLYEKALVLASGYLPQLKQDWLYYSGIGAELVQFLGQLLSAQVKEEKEYV